MKKALNGLSQISTLKNLGLTHHPHALSFMSSQVSPDSTGESDQAHNFISEKWLQSIGHSPGEESAIGWFDFARLTH